MNLEALYVAATALAQAGTPRAQELLGEVELEIKKQFPHTVGLQLDITARQRQILFLLAHGHSDKSIARVLGIAEGTVGSHKTNIFTKLGAITSTQAVYIATQLGLLNAMPAEVNEGTPWRRTTIHSGQSLGSQPGKFTPASSSLLGKAQPATASSATGTARRLEEAC